MTSSSEALVGRLSGCTASITSDASSSDASAQRGVARAARSGAARRAADALRTETPNTRTREREGLGSAPERPANIICHSETYTAVPIPGEQVRLAVRRPARHPYACGLRQRCVGPSQSTGAQRDALPALAARHLAAPLATPSRLVRAATPRHARPCSPNPLPRAATPARHGRDMATESAAWRSGAPSPARHA